MGNPVRKDIAETLTWLYEMGVDEAIASQPVNYFKQRMQRSVQAESSPVANTANAVKLPASQTAHYTPNVSEKSATTSPDESIAATRALADAAKDLDALRKAVVEFQGLSLCKTATNTVFSDGNPKAEIMFIGEAPGADEDRQGIPFCGASGQLLEQMLNCIGLYRDKNYYISNTIFWRPPGNRKPTPQELATCLPFVEKHIALIQPKVIILVGGTAVASLLESKKGITSMRGTYIDYTNPYLSKAIPVTPIFHPSYLLRSPGQKQHAWKDLLNIDAFIEKHNITR